MAPRFMGRALSLPAPGPFNATDQILTFQAPPMAPGSYTLDVAYLGTTDCLVAGPGLCIRPPAPNDLFAYRQDAHVLSGTTQTLSALVASADRLADAYVEAAGSSHFSSAYLPPGFVPVDFAYAKDGPSGAFDLRLYVVGYQQLSPGVFSGLLYLFDVPTNRAVDLNGAATGVTLALHGRPRALDVADDSYAYVAYDVDSTTWGIDVVSLNPAQPSNPSVQAVGPTFPDRQAVRVKVKSLEGSTRRVHVLHHDFGCEGGEGGLSPLGGDGELPGQPPICKGCPGGGTDPSRSLILEVLDFVGGAFGSAVASVVIENAAVPCGSPSLEDTGMDFNAAKDQMWVASPDQDRVRVINLTNHQTIGSPIPVGDFPTGVSLEVVQGGIERAYVANKLSDSYTVIFASNRSVDVSINLDTNGIADILPTDLVVNPNGAQLLVVASGASKIRSFVLPGNSLGPDYPADTSPKRIVIQRRTP